MKIVSLFDGMACGMLAMLRAGVEVDEYYAYEIDKYAIQTATHNFPNIIECGDVFKADFTQYKDVDFVVGGSPCTYWSIAQKNNRETEASGLGWELFSQYARALKEIKPRFFIYENNKSMSKAIRESITEAFGFDAICINSALVSAQNRQRLYWVGKRNEDGTYSKVDVQQPEDRGILLRDILDSGMDLTSRDKSFAYTTRCNGAIPEDTISRNRHSMVAELVNLPIGETKDGKSYCLTAGYSNGSGENIGNYAAHTLEKGCKSMVAEPLSPTVTGKGHTVNAGYSRVEVQKWYDRVYSDNPNKQQHDYIAEPVNTTSEGKAQCVRATCYKDGIRNMVGNDIDKRTCVAEAVNTTPNEKSQTIKAQYQQTSVANICKYTSTYGAGGKTGLYAMPIEFKDGIPTKAISSSDGKPYLVYSVANDIIVIKGKEYPIKLQDGYYIIRKLSVNECKRLQTVPDWYEFPVSNAQAYKMLGNGWTVEVIIHLIKSCLTKI
jgi:DNA (cytosine-5)-methyltransferase 3A